jgi:hypothetical protein
MRPRPAAFARYRAASAVASIVSGSLAPSAIPMLADSRCSAPPAKGGFLIDVIAHRDELVAAQARDGVPGAHGGLHPPGDLHQHGVPGGVAVSVVDLLESVEVDEQHGGRTTFALRPRHRQLEAVAQQRAIRYAGQRIVNRFVAGALLVPQPRKCSGERVRHGSDEAQLLVGQIA